MPIAAPVRALARDLHDIFGGRLQSLVVYGSSGAPGAGARAHDQAAAPSAAVPVHTMAVVESLDADDLQACAARVGAWQGAGLATPLMLAARELARSLDAFPLELAAIAADHVVVSGAPPFDGLRIDASDVRRACEVQARSHLLHLRQAYVEAADKGDALAQVIVQSAAPLAALVRTVARLRGADEADAAGAAREIQQATGVPGTALEDVVALAGAPSMPPDRARHLFPPYLHAVNRLVELVDGWR
jgi:hypothetical protein